MSEVVPCADFVFKVSIESGAKLFNSLGWVILFAVMYDYLVEVFFGCVYVSVGALLKSASVLSMCGVKFSVEEEAAQDTSVSAAVRQLASIINTGYYFQTRRAVFDNEKIRSLLKVISGSSPREQNKRRF